MYVFMCMHMCTHKRAHLHTQVKAADQKISFYKKTPKDSYNGLEK